VSIVGYRLEITWVKGHSRSKGNERVDGEVKREAKGESSHMCNLPKFLVEVVLPFRKLVAKGSGGAVDSQLEGVTEVYQAGGDRPRYAIQKVCQAGQGDEEIPGKHDNAARHGAHPIEQVFASDYKGRLATVPVVILMLCEH